MTETGTWMPLYIGDYLADTMHLTGGEHGAYLLLIMHYWRNGPLPDDDKTLASISRTERKEWANDVGPVVRQFFSQKDGRLHHKRIDGELARARGIRTDAVGRGRAGAAAKWGGTPTAGATRSARLAEARQKGRHIPEEWQAMLEFCRYSCVKCAVTDVEIVKDHIKPIYQGGSDGIENLQPLCVRCNAAKGADVTDHRKDGWQYACAKAATISPERLHPASKMPAKMPANCLQTPDPSPSPSPVEKETVLRPVSKDETLKRETPLGCRLPADWGPGDEGAAFGRGLGLDTARTLARFSDYWAGQPGAKGRKADWPATWRNWCRKEAEDRGTLPLSSPPDDGPRRPTPMSGGL